MTRAAADADVIEIGPYRFSRHDATATIRHTSDLFGLLVVDPARTASVDETIGAVVAPYRHRAMAATGEPLPVALATVWAELRAANRALRSRRLLGADAVGTVAQLNLSAGGVPKQSADRVDVDFDGVRGDRQRTRRHHGRPWQALCVWSADVVDRFAAAGHPLHYGSAGENVTVRDLPWERVRPGTRLVLGGVVAEVQAFALPCAQNARWFIDGDFAVMHHDRGPVSRVYATVIAPGEIRTGDRAELRAGED